MTRVLRDVRVRLVDLLEPDRPPVLEAFVFERCQLLGPAVLVTRGATQLRRCTFDSGGGDARSILWPLPASSIVVGGIATVDCLFEECLLRMVGIADTADVHDLLLADFARTDYPPDP